MRRLQVNVVLACIVFSIAGCGAEPDAPRPRYSSWVEIHGSYDNGRWWIKYEYDADSVVVRGDIPVTRYRTVAEVR